MEISLYPTNSNNSKCLILIGGTGDNVDRFKPFVEIISGQLKDYSICTFSFTESSESGSVLDLQAVELEEVFNYLESLSQFISIDVFATSRGSYSTIKLLSNPKHSQLVRKVIFYDPADYHLSAIDENSWSGPDAYTPTKPVITDELKKIESNCIIDVVHLTLRNYTKDGYWKENYKDRGQDNPNGYPRLNTAMVKKFFDNTPIKNRGIYLEEPHIPHGFIRDGNIFENLKHVAHTIKKLLSE